MEGVIENIWGCKKFGEISLQICENLKSWSKKISRISGKNKLLSIFLGRGRFYFKKFVVDLANNYHPP